MDANAYELMLAKLAEDRRRLKEVQSIERKIEIKRQILPDYAPWVQGALEAGRGGQDAVLMTVMVWRIDVGDFAGALDIAAYALRHGLVLPDQYQRDAATLIAEEIADQALASFSAG
ncbi:terminase, partial [Escherichia coli]|nr:terminase [Escherichia coli]